MNLQPLKKRKIKPDGFSTNMMEAWKQEIKNPTDPPPSNIPHKFRFLHKQPPLNTDWGPAEFLR